MMDSDPRDSVKASFNLANKNLTDFAALAKLEQVARLGRLDNLRSITSLDLTNNNLGTDGCLQISEVIR